MGVNVSLVQYKADGIPTMGVPSVPMSGSAISTLSLEGLVEVADLLMDT